MVRDAWVHNGGRTEQGQEGTQRFDIGSAFCTQEQWGISICERVSFYLGKERIGGGLDGDGSRCAHQSINQPQPGQVLYLGVGRYVPMPRERAKQQRASTHTHTLILWGLAWVLGKWCNWFHSFSPGVGGIWRRGGQA